MSGPTTDDERRRIAHAMVGYSRMKNQHDLAEALGLEYNQLRNILNNRDPAPSTDELRAMADRLGLPDEFAVYGFRAFAGWEPKKTPGQSIADVAGRRQRRRRGKPGEGPDDLPATGQGS